MRKALLIAALVTAPGCKKFNLGGLNLQEYLPKIAFDKLKVQKGGFEGMDSNFAFDVENPYPVNLNMDNFNYDLALEGADFLSGSSDEGIGLKSMDTMKMRLPARINFAEVFNLVGSLKDKDDVGFGLKGDFGVGTPVGPLKVPFNESGKFATLKIPKIVPKAVRVGQVNLLQNKARLEIDLDVTNNAKNSSYGMQDVAYGLKLGGTNVLDGALENLSVAAGATESRTIPLELNLLDLGSTLVSAITQKRPLDVGLAGGLKVDTPLGLIPLNFDEVKNLPLN